MHTFEIICNISPTTYNYLQSEIPALTRVASRVERSNFYSAKGITQIELRSYEFHALDIKKLQHFLVLRCNLPILMGYSKVFLLDMSKHSSIEILEKLQKRFHEINAFRYIKLHQEPLTSFRISRADLALDIMVASPQLVLWLCNMAFPYKYRRMTRTVIHKPLDQLYIESCCFQNGSRRINIYNKRLAMLNSGRSMDPKEEDLISQIVRIEIQIQKKGIYGMKLPTKRSVQPFLEQDFHNGYLEKEVISIFGTEKFVCMSKAIELIQNSSYKPYDKKILLSVINTIQQFNGLYELENAIDDETIHTPSQYGNLRCFKTRWLAKIRRLGIQPVVIPDSYGIDEIPSIYTLLSQSIQHPS